MSTVQTGLAPLSVPLSHLVPSRRNPRRVKPSRESDQCLLALIQTFGLLQPLVIRPLEGKPKHYEVVAGHRRLNALRKIYQGDRDPKILCVLFDGDPEDAEAISLGENFGRVEMHPLDEADAFAKLAKADGKEVESIASAFGVKSHYVRQRMKLAELAGVVKSAFRAGEIDIGTAEAFAAVPEDRQQEVWHEVDGHPRHAEHVRNIIASNWIDSKRAIFNVSTLPEVVVSQDLFSEQVLVERQAFMTAQMESLLAEREKLMEDGWKTVIAGRYENLRDSLMTMVQPDREFDEETTRVLEKLASRREKIETGLQEVADDDEKRLSRAQDRLQALWAESQKVEENAPPFYSEATKSVATLFLLLYDDGQVRRECRIERRRSQPSRSGGTNGSAEDSGGGGQPPPPPTSDNLGEKQLAVTFTQQAVAVREALLKNGSARRRVLALILHERVRSEGLAIRHDANGATLHASSEGFVSPPFDRLREKREKLDPFATQVNVGDCDAYEKLGEMSASKLDALIDVLTIECITAHLQRPTDLVTRLASELKVNIRDHWRPDAAWLAGFQKIQLAELTTQLLGAVHTPAPEKKKSELVEALAKLFTAAAEGTVEDKKLAERLNQWLPANLREAEESDKDPIS